MSDVQAKLTDALEQQTMKRMLEALQVDSSEMRQLDDGSVVYRTLRLPDASGQERPSVHLTVHPEHGIRWVAARDFCAGETLMCEEALVYVTNLEDTRDAPLQTRPVRRLLPDEPKRVRSIRRLFAKRRDLFGEGDDRLSMSLEWTLTFYLMTTQSADEVRRHVSKMRSAGRYAFANQVRQLFAKIPNMLSAIQDVARLLGEEREWRRALDEARAKLEAADDDTRQALESDVAKLLVDFREEHEAGLADQLERMRANFNEVRRDYADVRRWINVVRSAVPGGKEAYDEQEVLMVHASVVANALHMRSPLSHQVYGAALYPGVSHVRHSCVANSEPVFDVGGTVRFEALGAVREGAEVTVDRVLAGEPAIRCLATGPAWIRATFDATAGHRCRCSECEEALVWMRASAANMEYRRGETRDTPAANQEDVARVIAAGEAVWQDPPAPETRGDIGDGEIDAIVNFPLALNRTSSATASQAIDHIDGDYQRRLLAEPTLSWRAYDVARAIVEAAVRHPVYFGERLGAEAIGRAAAYEASQCERLVQAKLAEQGADAALINRRLITMRARTRHAAFVAAVAPTINDVVERSSDMDEMRRLLEPELPPHFQQRYVEQFRYTAAAIQLPSGASLVVGADAIRSAVDRLRLESLRVGVVGIAASVLNLHECGVGGADE